MFYVRNVTENYQYTCPYSTYEDAIEFIKWLVYKDLTVEGNVTDIYRIVAV